MGPSLHFQFSGFYSIFNHLIGNKFTEHMQNNCSIQLAAFSFYPLLFIKKKNKKAGLFFLFFPLLPFLFSIKELFMMQIVFFSFLFSVRLKRRRKILLLFSSLSSLSPC